MTTHDHAAWPHVHTFDAGNRAGERSTRRVLVITAAMMAVEIAAGWFANSMALLADGFHMSSHAVAIGLSAFAYRAARRHATDPRFAFGTWKIEVLGGFASAVFLLGVAVLMAYGSVERLFKPETILYPQALAIAAVGLAVNLVSAWILGAADHPGHAHGRHDHDHDHGPAPAQTYTHAAAAHADADAPRDLNLRSAYVHVLADAATSVAALLALAGGWWLGWAWLDPLIGLGGSVVVAAWARRLITDTGKVLLDREMDDPVVAAIRTRVAACGAASGTQITDLHVWRVGRASYACALSLVTHDAHLAPNQVRAWLAQHPEIVHSTIEIHRCEGS